VRLKPRCGESPSGVVTSQISEYTPTLFYVFTWIFNCHGFCYFILFLFFSFSTNVVTNNLSFWGFYLGRPFRVNAGDVSVPKPASDLNRAKEETWYPYGFINTQTSYPSRRLKDPRELISRQFAVLWEMISPLGHIL
jgi:hypothetical protein